MTEKEAREAKAQCLADVRGYMRGEAPKGNTFLSIDSRLTDYILDCVREDVDRANLFELLGIRKVLRLSETYPVDVAKARRVLLCYEGRWQGETHIEGSGGLLFTGLRGRTHYRLTPLQVWQLAVPFGFMRSGDDWRRLTTECIYFVPRKSSKTTMAAFFQVWFFFFEDFDSEGYCIANSQEQSKILFRLVYDLIRQIAKDDRRIRFTKTELSWKPNQPRASKIAALSAGGKTKDGLNCSLCCADEFGSASYVKDKSDMANLLNVVEGSMGSRREPLTVITTTAGRVNRGPFELKLDGVKQALMDELGLPIAAAKAETDWQFAQLLCPDIWEQDDLSLQQPYVWDKCNRHIGITIQKDFYKTEWVKMLRDDEKKREQITKLFNVFQSNRVRRWISSDEILGLTGKVSRVDDLNIEDGWRCYCGMDFASTGSDLCGVGYLCYSERRRMFFADCDMWVTERTLNTNQNSLLYKQWASQGWLHVCPGEVVRESELTDRIAQAARKVSFMRFGYDPYDALVFVNYLKAWIQSQGFNPQDLVFSVSQTWGQFNSAVQSMDRLVKLKAIEFSRNPLLPWVFGNAVLESDKYENVKPVKAAANAKIDPVICLLMGIIMLQGTGVVV